MIEMIFVTLRKILLGAVASLMMGAFSSSVAEAQQGPAPLSILDSGYIGVSAGYAFANIEMRSGTAGAALNEQGAIRDEALTLSGYIGLGTVIEDRYYLGWEFTGGYYGQSANSRSKSLSVGADTVNASLSHEYSLASYLRFGFFVENNALLYALFGWGRSSYDVFLSGGSNNTNAEIDFEMDGFAFGGGFEYPVLENFNARFQYRVTDYWEGKQGLFGEGQNQSVIASKPRDSIEHNFSFGIGYQF